MKTYVLVLLGMFAELASSLHASRKVRKFPDDFWFGASTAAYQIEGAWQEDGKAKSIWDDLTHHEPSLIKDASTGDVAADSYHLYKKDVEVAKELGLDFYKFSISWPRILPNGFSDKINPFAIEYYSKLIDELVSNNIHPMVTMYHWDLPANLQKLGGWTNPLIINWFKDYARVLFEKFGERVKYWITIQEPKQICVEGYGSTGRAPMLNMTGIAEYLCAKNILMAHATVYHLYDETFRKLQNGLVGIAIEFTWYEPASDTIDDHQAAVDAKMFGWGQYAHPIFSKAGDFPVEVKTNVAMKSAEQGFSTSRLPELSGVEVAMIRGSADFLGVNTFTTRLAYRDASLEGMYPIPSYFDDAGTVLVKDPNWTKSASSWLQEVPWGFSKLLLEIKALYDNPPVYITGNGWSTTGGLLDEGRISYLRTYLNALLDAIDEGCDIKCYSVWSLIDNFEWKRGYTEKFGLYEVDFSAPDKTRTPRKSAFIYKEIVRSKTLDPDFEPEKFLVEAPESQERTDRDVLLPEVV